jgi:two-component system NtrC family sensor kinase
LEAVVAITIVYYLISFLTNTIKRKDIFIILAILTYIIDYLLKYKGINFDISSLFFLSLILHAKFKKENVKMLSIVIAYYISLTLIVNFFQDFKFIKAFYFLGLVVLNQKSQTIEKIWLSAISVSFILSLINSNFISYGIALILLFFVYLKILEYKENLEENQDEFKKKIARTIEIEVKREYEKLELKLQLAYKKLKELFKLNTFIIKEISLNEMAQKIIEGLIDLGYAGAYIYISNENLSKKEGFIPNLKIITEEMKDKTIVSTFEDEKLIYIPLKDEKDLLGYLVVYSKTSLTPEEIEYLITYANSISNIIAKTDYFLEIVKLRDLIYRTIEAVNIGIVVLDRNFNIEILNNFARKFTNFENAINHNLFEVFPFFDSTKVYLEDVLYTKKEFEIKIKDQALNRIFEVKAFPISSEEALNGLVIVFEDVTEKEEMENQIIQSEKLAVIGRLAAGISHEIKNPLAIINQNAFMVKRRIQKLCSNVENIDNILESIERIERNVIRATDIIERLLNFSKPYYTKAEKVNLREVVEEAIKLAILQAQKSNISFSKKLVDAYVKGDKNALIQLFINLILNAIEAIENKGKITIKITTLKRTENVRVVIKDTGKGIPEDILDKIFEPFFTTKEKGTGLGLAVSYRILQDHGGKILVNSKEGEGTEFILTFPLFNEEN